MERSTRRSSVIQAPTNAFNNGYINNYNMNDDNIDNVNNGEVGLDVSGNVVHLGGLPNFFSTDGIDGYSRDEARATRSRVSEPIFARFRRGGVASPQHVVDGNGEDALSHDDDQRPQRARPSHDSTFTFGQSNDAS